MSAFLQKIISLTEERVKTLERGLPQLEPLPKRDFYSLFNKGSIVVIAETKKSSPSAGVLIEDYDPVKISCRYQDCGADAISCLTEPFYFGGDIKHLRQIKERISLPVLRKDFIISPLQIKESFVWGADAVLLIARILSSSQLRVLKEEAESLGLDILVEVFSEEDLEKVLREGFNIIGINNRNLNSFHTDINNTLKLLSLIPDSKIVISESGIKSNEDVMRLKEAGVKGLLIGEDFLKEKDLQEKISSYKKI